MAVPVKALTSLGNIKIPTVSENPWVDLGVKAGIVIGTAYGGFVLLREAGIIADKRGEKANKKAEQSDIKKLESEGIKPSYKESFYHQKADAAYNAMMHSAIADNKGLVVEIAKLMKNDLDVIKWSQAYGFRQRYIFIKDGPPTDLMTSISDELSGHTKKRNAINADWTVKGITFRV